MKILIFYFSGTGNTKFVANQLKDNLLSLGSSVDNFSITENLDISTINIDSYDMIGIGYSVHAFNAPKLVFEFINEKLPNQKDKKSFIFKTAGDSFMTGGSTSMVRKRLIRKGYSVFNESLFVMPANVFIKFPEKLVKQLYTLAILNSKRIANEIVENKICMQKNGMFLKFSTWIFSHMESSGAKIFGKTCKINENCNLCKKCVYECPKNNIYVEKDSIKFKWRCVFCMKCIYSCPQDAISNKFFSFFVIKDGYKQKNNMNIVKNPEIDANFLNQDTKGFYKHYYNYFKKNGLID